MLAQVDNNYNRAVAICMVVSGEDSSINGCWWTRNCKVHSIRSFLSTFYLQPRLLKVREPRPCARRAHCCLLIW